MAAIYEKAFGGYIADVPRMWSILGHCNQQWLYQTLPKRKKSLRDNLPC